ncbi:MAG: RDD family protein [Granulosicoccaceae bacterium]
MLRSTVSVATPEGTELRLAVAGLVPRSLAWAIDFCLRMLIYLVLVTVMGSVLIATFFDFEDSRDRLSYMVGIGSIIFFLLEWFFTAIPEALFGTTPGKKLLGLRVVHTDGTPLGWQSAILRNFLRFADFLPFFYFSAVVSMLVDSRSRRLGDFAAGSMVVYNQREKIDSSAAGKIAAIVPPFVLSPEERSVLLDFDERCTGLTEERQIELVSLLPELNLGQGMQAVETLRAWASWVRNGQEAHEHASAT